MASPCALHIPKSIDTSFTISLSSLGCHQPPVSQPVLVDLMRSAIVKAGVQGKMEWKCRKCEKLANKSSGGQQRTQAAQQNTPHSDIAILPSGITNHATPHIPPQPRPMPRNTMEAIDLTVPTPQIGRRAHGGSNSVTDLTSLPTPSSKGADTDDSDVLVISHSFRHASPSRGNSRKPGSTNMSASHSGFPATPSKTNTSMAKPSSNIIDVTIDFDDEVVILSPPQPPPPPLLRPQAQSTVLRDFLAPDYIAGLHAKDTEDIWGRALRLKELDKPKVLRRKPLAPKFGLQSSRLAELLTLRS